MQDKYLIFICFILIGILFYKQNSTRETMVELSTMEIDAQTKLITGIVKRVYLSDVESIRTLSNIAIKLQEASLTIPGDLTISGKLIVNGDTNVLGFLNVDKDTNVVGSLNVDKDTNVVGFLNVDKDTILSGSLKTVDVGVSGSLTVAKDTNVLGSLKTVDAGVSGSLTVAKDTFLSGTLKVALDTDISGTLTVANTNVSGKLKTAYADVSGILTAGTATVTDKLVAINQAIIGEKLVVPFANVFESIASDSKSLITKLLAINIPSRIVVSWSGDILMIPHGWALCDGKNGTPDLSGRFILGTGQNTGIDTKNGSNGKELSSRKHLTFGGAETHVLTYNEMPLHVHPVFSRVTLTKEELTFDNIKKSLDYSTSDGPEKLKKMFTTQDPNEYGVLMNNTYTGYAGLNKAHNIMPPFYVLAFIIKL